MPSPPVHKDVVFRSSLDLLSDLTRDRNLDGGVSSMFLDCASNATESIGGLGGSVLESLTIPLNDVKLGRELGRGGFGIVYEGTYAFQPVAVKPFYGTSLPGKKFNELLAEMNMMTKLHSLNIVRLIGLIFEPNSPPMIVMEYGANRSLYGYLNSDRDIGWSLRLRVAYELSRGLGYLHHKRIVHRDIKSLNAVLDQDLHAKWCDFGLATLKLHTTTTGRCGWWRCGHDSLDGTRIVFSKFVFPKHSVGCLCLGDGFP